MTIQKTILYFMVTTCLMTMTFFSYKAYIHAKVYEKTTASLILEMDAKKVAELRLKEIAEKFSFGLYQNDKKKKLDALRNNAQESKNKSLDYTLYAMLCLFVFLLSYFMLSLRVFTFFGATAAISMLIFGLITPIMMVTIHKDVEYLGDVVLSFESKGILGSISKLYENGDVVVAVVILLFSVLIPIVKTVSLGFVALFIKSDFAHGIVKFFKAIGKWSMVDVFVVATFLVYLTVDKGDISRAEVEVGLYFFLAYVIVSMLVSLSADKMLHNKN